MGSEKFCALSTMEGIVVNMNDMDKLYDMLHAEMMSQMQYNKYMMDIQSPEVRQMFMQMRDSKMQHITQLQQEIKRMMSGQ